MATSTRLQETQDGQTAEAQLSPWNTVLSRAFALDWETLLYVAIFLLAIFTRFYLLGDRVMSHDESLHTRYSYNLYKDGNFQHTPLMHGPILFHATALSYFLFGADDFTSRIYPAVLGVIMVMFPLLFRRWLGRWGSLLASIMILASPLLMYYNRYIRHDTPSILAALIMAYCILMYINGPEGRRRRGYWLYILAGAMLWNLGSKETSFIYIAIFGAFLTLFWLVRMAQHFWNLPGKTIFYFLVVGILLGGVVSLGMYIILDIVPLSTATAAAQSAGWFGSLESRSFLVWTLLTVVTVVAATAGTFLWAFRGSRARPQWRDMAVIVLIGLMVGMALIVLEEASHVSPNAATTAAPAVPGQESDAPTAISGLHWGPMALVWVLSAAAVFGLLYMRVSGWWEKLRIFPEFDVLIVMGTLILPWATAIVPYLMRGSPEDFSAIAQGVPQFIANAIPVTTSQEIGQVVVGFIAWLPLVIVAVTAGLLWDARRWLIAAGVFHVLFAFFFTTVFTNINGLATGMVYSLGYWLEQQGVRRGSQPQYYYLVLIMPFYEFLPVIGSVLAMLAGLTVFWRRRRTQLEYELDIAESVADGGEDWKGKPKDHDAADSDEMANGDQDIPTLSDVMGGRRAVHVDPTALVKQADAEGRLEYVPFLLFLSWWAILNLIGYTLAGEKMPWLGTHLTTPLILLTAWYFGRIFGRIDYRRFFKSGWLYLVLLPLLFVTLFHVVAPLLAGQSPTGLTQTQLSQTGQWFAVVAVSAVFIYVIYRLTVQTGWIQLRQVFTVAVFLTLVVLTFRSAWMASFINYDYATEYLVYAHAAPAVKTVLADLREISRRTTDGNDLVFGYDNEVSWPYSWYFRDFPNAIYFGSNPTMQRLNNAVAIVVGEANRAKVEPLVEDRYYRFEYIRLWWPMQDYFNLTAERVANTFDLSPGKEQAPRLRRGIFDIWWSRDYSAYGTAIGRDFNVTRWPVSDRMHLYVRKDIAAQIWPYGVGEATVLNPLEGQTVNQCNANWQQLSARTIFDTSQSPLNRPLGISIGPDGLVYVAEEYNFRVSIFDKEGNFVRSFGQQGTGDSEGALFNRPNSVGVAPDGTIYVADTWNYRIQQFSPDGQLIQRWGRAGEYGFDAKTEPLDAFWGPRDVVVDSEGRVYVADTGNKRIRVYGADGIHLRDIGFGGSGVGQLDEPAGMAISPDGRLYVADTWNRRISVFTLEGTPLNTFTVRGWYEELGNRPYLAVDPVRNMLYVTDPDGGRVLVYDLDGNCLGSFGQFNREAPDASQFGTLGGIVVDGDGFVYIADAGTGRILKFDPFVPPPMPENAGDGAGRDEGQSNQVFLNPEATDETAPESTQEIAE